MEKRDDRRPPMGTRDLARSERAARCARARRPAVRGVLSTGRMTSPEDAKPVTEITAPLAHGLTAP